MNTHYLVSEADGLQKSPKKVKAIVDMRVPEDVSQLRSFLRMVQYCAHFLPDLSTHLNPLHHLLAKDQKWSWGPKEEKSLKKVKKMSADDHVLIHFDPDLAVVVATNSSSYGLGALLSHELPDRSQRPIACA